MGTENDINPRCFFDNDILIFLRQATADCDLKIWIRLLLREHRSEVAVKLVVCVLADSTGIENY